MVDDMVHVMAHVMAHVMVLFFLGRWEKFQVLHSDFRVHPTAARFVKVLKTLGLV
jgi:hypothetical protein